MRGHWHIAAILLAVGLVVILWPGKSEEPQIAPPATSDEAPPIFVDSTVLEEPTKTQPATTHPESSELTQRAINARAVGDIETAIELFEQAISTDPSDVVALSNYGRLLTQTFAMDRAIEVLEAARDLQPSDAQTWLDLATVYERAQLFRESREALAKAQALVGADAITRDKHGRYVVEGTQLQ